MEEHSASYRLNINMTPANQRELKWKDVIDSIIDKAADKNKDNILLPIYRYAKLQDLMDFQVACIVHEC